MGQWVKGFAASAVPEAGFTSGTMESRKWEHRTDFARLVAGGDGTISGASRGGMISGDRCEAAHFDERANGTLVFNNHGVSLGNLGCIRAFSFREGLILPKLVIERESVERL
jgi:hypothetical protein